MKHCVQCTKNYEENINFCEHCGIELEDNIGNYSLIGIILSSTCALIGLLYFYHLLSKIHLPPGLQNDFINIHPALGFISLSFVSFSFFIALLGMIEDKKFPNGSSILQLIAVLSLSLCLVTGSMWAKDAWGSYWHWDPKETWSLIVLALLCFSFFRSHNRNIKDLKRLIPIAVSFIAIVWLFFLDSGILPSMHSYGIFSR
ncbi:MAG: cytochrome c biogenesis protein CcsA [Desulfobulbaceae bacterium]|uniref:Cytochrome c biogenesis protein CcsA n=1 Tax=Candidatus Desulfobia pelagia TaxID=2841692 RepID=A0A8J6TC19_9BACT|nr:cytochrome c biogenesis protein CcsA [Candidatus Desulfobia pelagia]